MSHPKKTFTPFLIPTTAMLLLALSSCEDRQAGEKENDRPNQAVDQRVTQPDTPTGRAQNNPDQGQERYDQGDPQRQMGNTTSGTTAGTTTAGTTTGGTGGGGTAGTTGGTSTGGTAGTSTGGTTTTDKTTAGTTTTDKTTD